MYQIIIHGPQGAGKGTQAQILSEKLGIPMLSMGQLLRDEIAKKSEMGLAIEDTLRKGELVDEKVTSEILKKRFAEPDATNGWILDGFPRMMAQYETFDFAEPTHVIVIEIPKEESIKRLTTRLTCDKCGYVSGESLGFSENQSCPLCEEGKFVAREDDTPEAIERRLEIYHTDTAPVLSEFEKDGILHRIDGVGTIEEVHERIQTLFT